ncbi:MAG: histidine kinase [Succiniclasticum sp.]|jgi:CheY-like chemotaxis protein
MKKLLLIDTSEITREMLTGTLEKDFKVVAVGNGTQGMHILETDNDFAIVVITLWHSGVRGLELLQSIRSDPRYKKLAVVIIEPEAIKDEVTSLTLGADDVIILPCEPEFILLKIKNVMMNRELLATSNSRNGLQNNILDGTNTAIFVIDAINYTLYYINHATSRLVGCQEKKYIGKSCYSFFMKENSPCSFCRLALAHTSQNTGEVYIPCIDKTLKETVRMMEWLGRPAYIVYADDITEQKKSYLLAEQKYQRELQRRSRVDLDFMAYLLMNVTKGIVVDHDPHGFPVPTISPGRPISDFVERVLPTVIDFETRQKFASMLSLENLQREFDEGNTFLHIDYRRYSRKNNIMWARSTIQLMKDPQTGDLTAFLYTYDIDEMHTMQETISAAVRYDYDLIAHVNLLNSKFKSYAAKYKHMRAFLKREYPYEETVKRYVRKHVIPAAQQEILQKADVRTVRKALEGQDSYEFIVPVMEYRHLHHKKFRFVCMDKQYGLALLTCNDVTSVLAEENIRNRRLERELEGARQAIQTRTKFIADFGEQVKKPLNTVIGMTSIVEEDARNEELVRRSAAAIKQSSDKLLTLVNDISHLGKLELNEVPLKEELFDLPVGLDLLKRQTRGILAAKNQQLVVAHQIYHQDCVADRNQLFKVFMNLVTVTSHLAPDGTKIKMKVFELPSLEMGKVHYHFLLQAENTELDGKQMRRFFEPFYYDAPLTLQKELTGMELAIARRVFQEYKGSLEVRVLDGNMLTFIGDAHFLSEASHAGKEQKPDGEEWKEFPMSRLRLLIAEDKPLRILVVRKLLESRGCKVDYVKDGQEAYQKFVHSEPGTYDLILTDLHLPKVGGYVAAHMIRSSSHPQAREIPIIATSDKPGEDNEEKCIAAGMNAYIPRPIKAEKFFREVCRLVSEQQAAK